MKAWTLEENRKWWRKRRKMKSMGCHYFQFGKYVLQAVYVALTSILIVLCEIN